MKEASKEKNQPRKPVRLSQRTLPSFFTFMEGLVGKDKTLRLLPPFGRLFHCLLLSFLHPSLEVFIKEIKDKNLKGRRKEREAVPFVLFPSFVFFSKKENRRKKGKDEGKRYRPKGATCHLFPFFSMVWITNPWKVKKGNGRWERHMVLNKRHMIYYPHLWCMCLLLRT